MQRKTVFILALALALVAALLGVILDDDLRDKLGNAYWLVAMVIIACILIVLSGYAFDLTLQKRLKTLNATAHALPVPDAAGAPDHDEIIGLARNIERMAQTLQKVEASYRGIVEDQSDLICRYRPDGALSFVNGAYERAVGKKRAELIGQPFPHFSPAESAGNDPHVFERQLERGDRRAWVMWTQRAIRDNDGNLLEYQMVGHDITARREAEAALLCAKEAAEAADRAKSEFLAVVSHEIRTPINGVIGFAKMLDESVLTKDQREQVAMIHASGLALEKLITDILDLSKIEAGKIDIEHTPFALHREVEDACAFFAQKARAAGLTLDIAIDPEVPTIVNGDAARLRQILTNLVGNALKFTERGGVDVRVTCEKGDALPDGVHHGVRLNFEVSDTGIGIPPQKIGELFKPFSQVDTSSRRRRGGTGLGLVISRRLCGFMGGAISVESQLNQGSSFRFWILADYDKRDSAIPFAGSAARTS